MTDAVISPASAAPRHIGPPRLQWGVAFKALRRLFRDKEDTGQVFEIMRALNGRSTAKGYHRLLATAEGGRMAYEREEFAKRLMDDAWLDSFAAGTVGAAYRDFVRSENLSAQGLAEVSQQNAKEVDVAHPYAWFGRRTRDVHDIWHILSGYHRDGLGEACLVAFSFAQTGGLGWAFIAAGAASRSRKAARPHPYRRAIWQGYQRGKAAKWLLGEDYARVMSEPLEAARKRLNITPATLYDAIPPEDRDMTAARAAA
ncbi:Coq4 family protein [Phenylobacterium sp.]|uniref:Coq4 family protein n=1 Tax=Phenylobacterium sp. TaxID=1871053 RepID=UPI0035AD9511